MGVTTAKAVSRMPPPDKMLCSAAPPAADCQHAAVIAARAMPFVKGASLPHSPATPQARTSHSKLDRCSNRRRRTQSAMARFTALAALVSLLLLVDVATSQEEACSGHGKVHGNHCHCEKGYTNKGLECLPTGSGSSSASCAAGGVAWEASSLLFLEKGSYTIELVNNTESMATFLLPLANVTDATIEVLEASVELANQLLEDITLARKVVKNSQVIAPTNKLLYVIARNNMEELEKLKAACEAVVGNTWHIDHCDGPEGHGSRRHRRRLAVEPITNINMTVDASAHYALHLQHNAVEEFAMRILNAQGQSIQALVTKHADESEDGSHDTAAPSKKATGAVWLKTMGAVAVVTIVSVVGIMLLVVKASLLDKLMDAFIALSAGALFGTGIIHILPESIEFYSEYGQMDLTICTVYLAGFMIAMVVEMLLELFIGQFADGAGDHHDPHSLNLAASKDAAKMLSPSTPARQLANPDSASNEPFTDIAAIENAGTSVVPSRKSRWSLSVEWSKIKPMAYIILLGDLFHNFVDGVLIATAFLACDDSLGIAVMASAILHEIPQELADFIVLVDSGFTKFQAIVFNFISALSSFVGAFIILSAVTVTNSTMGLLLGFGAGTLTYISATDLLPRVLRVRSVADFFIRIILFAVGIGLLMLTTLYHVHCTV